MSISDSALRRRWEKRTEERRVRPPRPPMPPKMHFGEVYRYKYIYPASRYFFAPSSKEIIGMRITKDKVLIIHHDDSSSPAVGKTCGFYSVIGGIWEPI